MPKILSSSPSSQDKKPYSSSIPSSFPEAKPTTSSPDTSPSRKGRGRAWTGNEKVKQFETVLEHGAKVKAFEGLIAGRTAQQCYLTWHNTLEPAIKRSLRG